MLKYPIQGKIITVHGEKEYMISHLNSFRYMELDGEFIETPFQHFEEVLQDVAVTKVVSQVPKITRPPLRMSSLKDAKAVIEEGAQKAVRRARAGGPPLKISNHQVSTVEDNEDSYNLEDWIFSTVNGGLSNWEAGDFVPITFIQQ